MSATLAANRRKRYAVHVRVLLINHLFVYDDECHE